MNTGQLDKKLMTNKLQQMLFTLILVVLCTSSQYQLVVPQNVFQFTISANTHIQIRLNWAGSQNLDVYVYSEGMALFSNHTFYQKTSTRQMGFANMTTFSIVPGNYYIRIDIPEKNNFGANYSLFLNILGYGNQVFSGKVFNYHHNPELHPTIVDVETDMISRTGFCQVNMTYPGPVSQLKLIPPSEIFDQYETNYAIIPIGSLSSKIDRLVLAEDGIWKFVFLFDFEPLTSLQTIKFSLQQNEVNNTQNQCVFDGQKYYVRTQKDGREKQIKEDSVDSLKLVLFFFATIGMLYILSCSVNWKAVKGINYRAQSLVSKLKRNNQIITVPVEQYQFIACQHCSFRHCDILLTQCQHVFHKKCMANLLKPSVTCPKCNLTQQQSKFMVMQVDGDKDKYHWRKPFQQFLKKSFAQHYEDRLKEMKQEWQKNVQRMNDRKQKGEKEQGSDSEDQDEEPMILLKNKKSESMVSLKEKDQEWIIFGKSRQKDLGSDSGEDQEPMIFVKKKEKQQNDSQEQDEESMISVKIKKQKPKNIPKQKDQEPMITLKKKDESMSVHAQKESQQKNELFVDE